MKIQKTQSNNSDQFCLNMTKYIEQHLYCTCRMSQSYIVNTWTGSMTHLIKLYKRHSKHKTLVS